MKKRIWELDALRGLLIIIMIAVHFCYDLSDLFGLVRLNENWLYRVAKGYTGILFFPLSGICVTLGTRPVRRALTVSLPAAWPVHW